MSARAELDEILKALPESEQRHALSVLTRSLIEAGRIVWPDNTWLKDENGNQIGHIFIVDLTTMEYVPPTPMTEADFARLALDPEDTVPIEECIGHFKIKDRAVPAGDRNLNGREKVGGEGDAMNRPEVDLKS